jgi:plasmid stabilization system protein ParE
MKHVAYHRLAASELIKSARFYERRNSTLGDAFLDSVEQLIIEIQRTPTIGKPGLHNTRSRRTKRFPFRIVYIEQADRFWIVAVAHLSRRPNYWARRLGNA